MRPSASDVLPTRIRLLPEARVVLVEVHEVARGRSAVRRLGSRVELPEILPLVARGAWLGSRVELPEILPLAARGALKVLHVGAGQAHELLLVWQRSGHGPVDPA